MTEPKKYRRDWTIEPDPSFYARGFQWYKHEKDMDNIHYCKTVEEAESEIDNYIILEQEQVIEKLIDALRESNAMLSEGNFTLQQVDLVRQQIKANQNLINAFKNNV